MFYEEEAQQEEGEGLDIGRYIQAVKKRWWLILSIFIVITVPWLLYVKSLPPSYEAFCDIEFRSLEAETTNIISESKIIKLRSRTFAEKVVAQLGLTLIIDSKKQGFSRHQLFAEFKTNTEPRAGDYIFRKKDDGTYSIHWIDGDIERPIDQGSILQATLNLKETNAGFSFKLASKVSNLPQKVTFQISLFKYAVIAFRRQTNVSFRGPKILRLTMADRDPVLVAKMVNGLADIYVDESRFLSKSSVEDHKKIIEERMNKAKEKLIESEEKLKEFKRTHVVSLDAETSNRVTDLHKSENQIESYQKQKGDLDELLNKLQQSDYSVEDKARLKYVYRELAKLPTFETNYKMGALRSQLQDLETEYDEVTRGGLTKKHKRAIELENNIAVIHTEIKEEAKNHRNEISKEIASLKGDVSNLRYNLKQKLPEDEARLMELQREVRSNEEIYNQLNSQASILTISETVETESVNILDPALVPDFPINRDKKKKAIMGAFLGFALGLGLAIGLEFLDKSIKSVADVKKYLRLQVLGTIPNIDFKDIGDFQDSEKVKQIDQQLVTYDYSPTPIGEAYRSLRTNLVFSKAAGRIQTFVITSTSPGDGKSFTAANMAISIAQHKSSTLLIDADLRRGVLHNTFGIPKEPGFTNYLTNMVSFAHIINETLIPNLSMISCGSLLPNPSELLGSHQMKRFLDEAGRKFDIIIFDTPPLNAATDAIVLGTQVEAVVVVIRSGVTNRKIAQQKMELFKNVPARVLGVVLNGTTAEFGHDGYSYYHY